MPSHVGPIVILVSGGHAAGKHSAQQLLLEELATRGITKTNPAHSLDMEDYKFPVDIDKEAKQPLKPSRYDFNKLKSDIKNIPSGNIVVVIGLYALYDRELRESAQLKVFIDSDPDARLIRWIRRDVDKSQGGQVADPLKNLESVLDLYLNGARTEMSDYIFQTKEFADVILPRGVEQHPISLVIDGIQPLLDVKPSSTITKNTLRPSRFSQERFDNEKGKFYELN